MDHEVFEKEMIDGVNRNAGEKTERPRSAIVTTQSVFTKSDRTCLKRGLKHMVIALLTATLFAIAICGLIVTAIAPGYLAVLLFFTSLLAFVFASVLLYAQGIVHIESLGDDK